VESLIAHPATMTHASMAPEARRRAGISDSLLRLSVGIEDGADLTRDLRAALDRAAAITPNRQALPARARCWRKPSVRAS
jgi:cystathionine gamma-synthase